MSLLSAFIFSVFLASNAFATTLVETELQKTGLAGLFTWVVGIVVLIGIVTFSFAIGRIIKRSGQVVSSDSGRSSLSASSKTSKSSHKLKSTNWVSFEHRSPVIYRVSYSLPTQIYNGISLQFDWSTFNWYFATRGYYKVNPSKISGLSLSNPRFSARVYDFELGIWRYELRKEDHLLFHSSLNLDQRKKINTYLEKVKMEDRQPLLNLLSNQIDWRLKSGKDAIDKPDVYLRSLINKYNKGTLDLTAISKEKLVETKDNVVNLVEQSSSLTKLSDGYVDPVTGEFFPNKDVNNNVQHDDFIDKPSLPVIDETLMREAA